MVGVHIGKPYLGRGARGWGLYTHKTTPPHQGAIMRERVIIILHPCTMAIVKTCTALSQFHINKHANTLRSTQPVGNDIKHVFHSPTHDVHVQARASLSCVIAVMASLLSWPSLPSSPNLDASSLSWLSTLDASSLSLRSLLSLFSLLAALLHLSAISFGSGNSSHVLSTRLNANDLSTFKAFSNFSFRCMVRSLLSLFSSSSCLSLLSS